MGVFGGGEPSYAGPTFTAVATTTTEVLGANIRRKQATIVNDSDTPVYLGIGAAAVVGSGTRLNSNGGTIQIGGGGGTDLTTDAVNAIHGGTGTKNVAVQEAT